VISNELIRYYESLIASRKPVPPEENPHLREYIAEIRDARETRVIVRDLRNRAGIETVQWGSSAWKVQLRCA
jgi:ribosomal protein S24E